MIWLREINSALLNHTKTLMQNTKDFYGKPINAKVMIRNPHIDLEEEDYPSITIHNSGIRQATHFSDVNSREIVEVSPGIKTKKLKSPVFEFIYQIDIWTTSRLEMDSLSYAWVSHNPRYATLDVLDSNGKDIVVCNFDQQDPTLADFTNEKGDNIYRTIIPCRVYVHVDNEVTTTSEHAMVSDVVTNIHK